VAGALLVPAVRADGDFPPPERLEKEILRFEDADAKSPPPEGAVVVLGSSSIRFWHERLGQDLAPIAIVPRGFGGSTVADALFYLDRIVFPCRPRAIVLYEGDNDIAWGVTPRDFRGKFDELVRAVHERLPETRFYVLSIKPSPARWGRWPAMQEANRLLREACDADPRLVWVDVATPMLGDDGRPRAELFLFDRLHMNRRGYRIWRDALRPVLLARETAHEAPRADSGLEADLRR
jgi:lysophospholipase L1-like esterase